MEETHMKRTFFVATLLLVLSASLYAQSGSINNTLGSGGWFIIKDGSTTFLTLSQSDGYLTLGNSITLPSTTLSSLGIIFKGADKFIHDYHAAGTDGYNTFVGINSGNFTMSGSGGEASYNTAVGTLSLSSLTTGNYNSAFGTYSLNADDAGYHNCAFGNISLRSNTSGNFNTAFGSQALWQNSTSDGNSAFGYNSLGFNTGSANSAFGEQALSQKTTGDYNSAFGFFSLAYSTGNNNTALGDYAGYNITSGSNNTCIGHDAQVPSATSDNQVRIGDTNVTYAGVQVAWTITSDRRWKSNVTGSDLGLNFVSKLNPVCYTRKNDEKQRTEYGFIAQEIEEVLKDAGVEKAGMLTVDDEGMYELRYNDLLAPMVKAIQELKTENDALKNELVTLRTSIAEQVKNEVKTALLKPVQQEDATTKVSLNDTKN
jgi:hypothetical protein